MQIASKFTVAVHILTCIEIFGSERRVTSDFLSGSTGVNAVLYGTFSESSERRE